MNMKYFSHMIQVPLKKPKQSSHSFIHAMSEIRPKVTKHKADYPGKNNEKAKQTSPPSSLIINLFLLHLKK